MSSLLFQVKRFDGVWQSYPASVDERCAASGADKSKFFARGGIKPLRKATPPNGALVA